MKRRGVKSNFTYILAGVLLFFAALSLAFLGFGGFLTGKAIVIPSGIDLSKYIGDNSIQTYYVPMYRQWQVGKAGNGLDLYTSGALVYSAVMYASETKVIPDSCVGEGQEITLGDGSKILIYPQIKEVSYNISQHNPEYYFSSGNFSYYLLDKESLGNGFCIKQNISIVVQTTEEALLGNAHIQTTPFKTGFVSYSTQVQSARWVSLPGSASSSAVPLQDIVSSVDLNAIKDYYSSTNWSGYVGKGDMVMSDARSWGSDPYIFRPYSIKNGNDAAIWEDSRSSNVSSWQANVSMCIGTPQKFLLNDGTYLDVYPNINALRANYDGPGQRPLLKYTSDYGASATRGFCLQIQKISIYFTNNSVYNYFIYFPKDSSDYYFSNDISPSGTAILKTINLTGGLWFSLGDTLKDNMSIPNSDNCEDTNRGIHTDVAGATSQSGLFYFSLNGLPCSVSSSCVKAEKVYGGAECSYDGGRITENSCSGPVLHTLYGGDYNFGAGAYRYYLGLFQTNFSIPSLDNIGVSPYSSNIYSWGRLENGYCLPDFANVSGYSVASARWVKVNAGLNEDAKKYSLDTSFGNQGIVNTSFPINSSIINSFLLPGGKILAVGSFLDIGETFGMKKYHPTSYSSYPWFLTRYNSDGTLDTSFGNQGIVTSGLNNSRIFSSVVDSQGRILIAGTISDKILVENLISDPSRIFAYYSNSSIFLTRYNSDGTLDTSFGNQGIVITSVKYSLGKKWIQGTNGENASQTGATSVRVDGQDNIIIAGYYPLHEFFSFSGGYATSDPNPSSFMLAKYYSNGTVDKSFGINGTLITNLGQDYLATLSSIYYNWSHIPFEKTRDVQVDGQGNIFLAGQVRSDQQISDPLTHGYLIKYLPNGTIDKSFGNGYNASWRLPVYGGRVYQDKNSESNIAMSYSNYGLWLPFPVSSIYVQYDGNIVMLGRTINGKVAVMRANPNGSLDKSFGDANSGMIVFDFNNKDEWSDPVRLIRDGDGYLIVGSSSFVSIGLSGVVDSFENYKKSSFAVARIFENGSVDRCFGDSLCQDGGKLIFNNVSDKSFASDAFLNRGMFGIGNPELVIAGSIDSNFGLVKASPVLDTSCKDSDWFSVLVPENCPVSGNQTKKWFNEGFCSGGVNHSTEIIPCEYVPPSPLCSDFVYSGWSSCSPTGVQTRSVLSSVPSPCQGGVLPNLSQSCDISRVCMDSDWNFYLTPEVCPSSKQQTKYWVKNSFCSGGVIHSNENISCSVQSSCVPYSYSDWSECNSNNLRTRTIINLGYANCSDSPVLSQSCAYLPPCSEANWQFSLNPMICPIGEQQTKTWTNIGSCSGGVTHSTEIIPCQYVPNSSECTMFNYSEWGVCSGGQQNRTVLGSFPSGCSGGNLITVRICDNNTNSICIANQTISCDNVENGIARGYKNKCNENGTAWTNNGCELICNSGYVLSGSRCININFKSQLTKEDLSGVVDGNLTYVKDKLMNTTLFKVKGSNLSVLSLDNIKIRRSNISDRREYLLLTNLSLTSGLTKTIQIERKNASSNGVCIRDSEVQDLNELTEKCMRLACPGTLGNYNCSLEGDTFSISGLTHSGVIEDYLYCGDGTCSSNENCSSCSIDCGTCAPVLSVGSGSSGGSGGGSSGGGSSGGLPRNIENAGGNTSNQPLNITMGNSNLSGGGLNVSVQKNSTSSGALVSRDMLYILAGILLGVGVLALIIFFISSRSGEGSKIRRIEHLIGEGVDSVFLGKVEDARESYKLAKNLFDSLSNKDEKVKEQLVELYGMLG